MAAVTTHIQDPIKIQETSDDEPYSPNTRDTTTPDYQEEDKPIHTSSFSIHNVLKKERDSNSPDNVFSTEKLLQNTPNFEDSRNSESVSPLNEEDVSRAEISVDDENSCSSDDTVLSVGNEAPVSSFDHPERSEPGLTSFKHIQTHLNAISQLSQNINMNQPLLLRPSPITPNPLMFLNQPLLFQTPLMSHDLKSGVSRMPIPQANMNLSPSQFGLNFGYRKTQDLRRTDENRRLNYMPKSPENDSERDFMNQSLKFSIDNILKADFGRRITDPLNKRKAREKTRHFEPKTAVVKEPVAKPEESRIPEVKPSDKGAIDLSKSDDSGSNSSAPGKIFFNSFSFSMKLGE